MAKTFEVDVVTPEGSVWSGEAEFCIARTTEGELGILADHEPVMAALTTGPVIIESGNDRTTIGVHGGFLQVVSNQVTLLTDWARITEAPDRDEAAKVAEELRQLEAEQQDEEASGDAG